MMTLMIECRVLINTPVVAYKQSGKREGTTRYAPSNPIRAFVANIYLQLETNVSLVTIGSGDCHLRLHKLAHMTAI